MDRRPNPDQLLNRVRSEEEASRRGRLKLFFGASPGVGKTYAMLEAARQRKKEDVDIVVGIVETHGRSETAALLEGLELLPRRRMDYKGVQLEEFDLDAALTRKPSLLLVDELAHTNAPGSRHAKRWQDVEEILDAGISVYTTLNVQHWESLNDVVAQITGVVVRETVPDTFLKRAHDVELVDLSPEDLLKRLKEGKVYRGLNAERAADNFFQPGNLIALRELALRHTAERVDAQVQAFKEDHAIRGVWHVSERLLVGVTASPMSARLVRATHRLATRLRAPWVVLHIETPETAGMPARDRDRLVETLRLAKDLGGETVTLTGTDVTQTLLDYARARNVTKIIIGKPARPRWREWISGSVVNEVARRCGDIDLYVISGVGPEFSSRRAAEPMKKMRWQSCAAAVAMVAGATLICWPLRHMFEVTNLVMIYLSGIIAVAYYLGRTPSMIASVLSVLCFDFFYVPPYFTFAVSDTQYVLTFIVMLGAGLLISALTGRLRQQTEAVQEREAQTRLLYQLSRELSETPDRAVLLDKAWKRLEDFYKVPVLLLIAGKDGHLLTSAGQPDRFEFDEKEMSVAKWVFDHGQEAGIGTSTLAGAKGVYFPLKGVRSTVGVLALRPKEMSDVTPPSEMQLLETFASEIGGALESTQMSEEAGRAEAEIETERLRNLLLTSFSSDLQAPLADLHKKTKRLLDSSATAKPVERQALLSEIQADVQRLESLSKDLPQLLDLESRRDKL